VTTATSLDELDEFRARARAWLLENTVERPHAAANWGVGSDDVSVFHNLSFEEEAALLARAQEWQRRKCDAGFAALTRPVEFGGQGLAPEFDEVYEQEESRFVTPEGHETFSVTKNLIAPTILIMGTDAQRQRFVRPFLRTEVLCAQLFSEPGSGSDLASLSTRAERDGDDWVVNGQKVWSSGAQFATWGELITRTDPDVVKHAGMTAFIVPMATPGIEVRPIGQMSGGASFCEVFFNDVRIPDNLRLGDVGDGWKVTLTTLGFERGNATRMQRIGGGWRQIRALAEHLGRTGEPLIRQQLMEVYIGQRVGELSAQRIEASARAGAPGPEGSISKLAWTQQLERVSHVATSLLGPKLVADTGEWGTYAWAEHVLGAPGYRIAGGSDEIQRNIIGERVLGLPAEPRSDRGPWRELPR
jgi:alkylation response protein AidB-like acyl-CoA dehydrogenase